MTLLPNLPDIGEYAPKIFPSLIMLFDGLKRAYEAAKDDEDSDDDSDEVRNFFFNLICLFCFICYYPKHI